MNVNLFDQGGNVVATVEVPNQLPGVIKHKGKYFIYKLGRYVEATMVEIP